MYIRWTIYVSYKLNYTVRIIITKQKAFSLISSKCSLITNPVEEKFSNIALRHFYGTLKVLDLRLREAGV